MSIGDALNFPFQNNNLLKILPIALAYGIVMFLFNYGLIMENFLVLIFAGLVMILFSLVIAGYYISVSRRIQQGNEHLPDVDISNDMKQGCVTSFAGLIYYIPLFIVLFAVIIMGSMGGSVGKLLIGIGVLACIPLFFILSAAMLIGLMRYADEERSGALYALGENFSMAKSNMGVFFGLFGRLIVLGFITIIVSFVLGIVLGVFFPNQNSPFFQPSTAYWLGYALAQVVTYTVSLVFALSQYHLITHYGIELGIGVTSKRKPVDEKYAF